MRGIELRIEANPRAVSAAEYAQLHLWRRVVRQQRQPRVDLADAVADPLGEMHAGGKAGEQFVLPVRRHKRFSRT